MSNPCNIDISKPLPASFKGIPFPVQTSSITGGRRGVSGEFPLSENIDYADLGVKADRYSFSGMFSGRHHKLESALFYSACKSPEPGVLIHPTKGIIIAACVNISLSNDWYEGLNVTEFKADFVEAPQSFYLDDILHYVTNISINVFLKDFIEAFKDSIHVNKFIWAEQENIIFHLKDHINILSDAYLATSIAAPAVKWGLLQKIHELNIRSLINDSDDLSKVLYNLIDYILQDSIQDNTYQINICKKLLNSINIISENNISNLIVCYIRIVVLSRLVNLYKNNIQQYAIDLEDTINMINTIFHEELEIIDAAGSDLMYDVVYKFRIEVLKFFYDLLYTSRSNVTYQFPGSVPPLVAAWEIYGDATKSDELRRLNQVTNLVIQNEVDAIV